MKHRPIKITNISVHFPPHAPCFEHFSATINHGDKIAIIGPNGAGKSTLLQDPRIGLKDAI